ncbi:MAG: Rne/Rng family ribonuclease [bacterium]
MKREIIINVESFETRIGVKEDGELVEFMVERAGAHLSVGNIYKAVVTAVLPGMQAAFLDIGYDRSAFLHVSDMAIDLGDYEEIEDRLSMTEQEVILSAQKVKGTQIEKVLHKGQQVIVQIAKEPIGTKGPRVSSQISLPGRYVVLVPNTDLIGVSRKIESKEERQRLREIIKEIKPNGMGVIVRTAGEGMDRRRFETDIRFLINLWMKITKKAKKAKAPCLLYEDLGIISRVVRDLFTDDVTSLVIDSKKEYRKILSYVKSFDPSLRSRVHLYVEDTPIFDAYEIEKETEKILNRIVPLKKGGFISIDHTEALVAIDVNTGRYKGGKDQEETALRTNLQAAKEIARQLRLRDLGGIIVIDFIDMELEENRKKVLDELRNHLRRDRSRTKALRVSEMGLVEMTRQRVRPSLNQILSEVCSCCNGSGLVLSLESIELKLERCLRRMVSRTNERKIEIFLNPEVAFHMLSENARRIVHLEKRFKLQVDVKDDPNLNRAEFVVRSLRNGEDLTPLVET